MVMELQIIICLVFGCMNSAISSSYSLIVDFLDAEADSNFSLKLVAKNDL